jgi:L-aminopeptidase/D-esterase-like protein
VRGGAPATREFELLEPSRTVARIDAVVLTGGSAFGLAAADGVMRFCEERGMGFPTAGGPVPIVPTMGLYDLAEGDGSVRPGADEGYAACEAATAATGELMLGAVGAGTGATVAKWRGREHARPGGIGGAVLQRDELIVAALVAVNAFGDLLQPGDVEPRVPPPPVETAEASFANTTIGVVVTNATLTKSECLLVAHSGHDGVSRSLAPVHSPADGDALVSAATAQVVASIEAVRALAASVVEQAIRSAVSVA